MNILKAAMTVSAMTFLSRVTGLIREMLTARLLGVSAETDAFFIAFRIPNLLRRLFAEGAFSQTFVPVLAQVHQQQGHDHTAALVRNVATVLTWVLMAVVIFGVLGASAVVWLMASGLRSNPASFELTVLLTRWMLPYIVLISLVSLACSVLNIHRKFAVAAFTPVLLNLSFIIAIWLVAPYLSHPVYALAGAVICGGIAQLALQVFALKSLRLSISPFWRISQIKMAWVHPMVRKIVQQMVPASLAVSVAQISLIINTQIASHLATGSVSWVSFGDRLMEFPTALLGVALGSVLLPSLSKAAAHENTQEYSRLLDWGLRLTFVLAWPAAVGLALCAYALTAIVFHYGQFSALDVTMTAQAVLGYSIGLMGLIAVKVLAPGFYAKQDIRTPVKIGIIVVICTQLLNCVFVPFFGHAGLTLSVGLGATINALVLFWGLRWRGLYKPSSGWLGLFVRLIIAGLAMGLFLYFIQIQFDWLAMSIAPFKRVAWALLMIFGAVLVYFGVLSFMGLSPKRLFHKPQ